MATLDGVRLVGGGGISYAVFDPPWWRLDRWIIWTLARRLPGGWWLGRPATGHVDMQFGARPVRVRVLEVRR